MWYNNRIMKFIALSSGSSGNCVYLEEEGNAVLIDCGISIRALETGLRSIGSDLSAIKAVLVTHEHNDHIKGLDNLTRLMDVPVYCHKSTADCLGGSLLKNDLIIPFEKGFEFPFMKVDFSECSHDASFCVGYRVTGERDRFVSLTDTGELPVDFVDFVKGADTVLLESNYDPIMLKTGPYPAFLKKRISGSHGHLSNEQAAEALKKLPDLNVKRVFLGHLSQNNNTAELAFNVAVSNLSHCGITEGRDLRVFVIPHGKRSMFTDVGV